MCETTTLKGGIGILPTKEDNTGPLRKFRERSTDQYHRERSLKASWRWSSLFFFSSRRRHTRLQGDWSSDVCSSDLTAGERMRASFRDRQGFRDARGRRGAAEDHDAAAAATVAGDGSDFPGWRAPHEIGRASCRERV